MPDTPSNAGASYATNPNPVKHLALLLGEPDHISDLTAALRYKGLAVVGAAPVDANGEANPEGLTEYLSDMSDTFLSGSAIEKVHILEFPGAGVDIDTLISSIESIHGGVGVSRVPVETEDGARVYFEEAHSLEPELDGEPDEEMDDGEAYIKSLLVDPSFRQTLREEAERLRKEHGLQEFPEIPDPFSLTSESGSDSDSGDGDQGTLEGLERVEPKTLSEAKVFLEGRNDSLMKEVDGLTRENRELTGRVASLEDRVTGLLRILDRLSNVFESSCQE